MNNTNKLFLFLITILYSQPGYTQQIKTFFTNACTFYYEQKSSPIQKPAFSTVDYVACSVQGNPTKPQQDVLLLPKGGTWHNDDNNLIFEKGSVELTEKNNVYFGVFDGHGIEYDSKSTRPVSNNWGFKIAESVASLFVGYCVNVPDCCKNMRSIFKKIDDRTLKQDYGANGGTTACVCKIDPSGTGAIFNVGDSRAVWGLGDKQSTIDHDVSHSGDAARMQVICERVKLLEKDAENPIAEGCIIIERPDIYYAEAKTQLKILRSFGHSKMRSIDEITKKNNNKEFVALEEPIELINAIPDAYENINSPLVFMGSDGCFKRTSNNGIYSICETLFKEGKSLDFIASAIMLYINLAEHNNNKSKIDSAIDQSNVQEVLKLSSDQNDHNVIRKSLTDNDFSKWHDNTSFILLHIKKNESNVEPKSTWHFMPVNKERAILLLLLLMGISCRYFYTNNYF